MLREHLHPERHARPVALRAHRGHPIDIPAMIAAVGLPIMKPPTIDAERIKPRLEKAVFGFGFINPMLALPQIYNIYVSHHVAGLSTVTIGSALIMSLLWTAYGVLGRQTVLWTTNAVWVVLNGAALAGVATLSG